MIRPTSRRRRSRPRRGCSGRPRRRCPPPSELDFRERASDWIEDWLAFAGEDALDDQVRFDREWAALRSYAEARGVKLIGDIPIYVAARLEPTSWRTRRSSRPARSPACRPTPSPTRASYGATRCTTGRRCAARGTRGGSRASSVSSSSSTWRGSTTSAASAPTGPCPRTPSSPCPERGSAARGARRSTRARAVLGELPLIAEDLGVITPPVHAAARVAGAARHVRAAVRLHAGRESTPSHVPENNAEDQVVYTGTHDSDTIRGWYESITPAQRDPRRRLARAPRDRGPRDPLGADPARPSPHRP